MWWRRGGGRGRGDGVSLSERALVLVLVGNDGALAEEIEMIKRELQE